MGDIAPKARWAGVSEFEFVRLLRRGRSRGRLTLDEVIDVLQDAELTPELIGEIRAALDEGGIELDETVFAVDLTGSDGVDEQEARRLIRPRHRSVRRRDPARHPSERGDSGDSTRTYLQEIGEVPLLTAAEEVELASAISDGNEAEVELADLAVTGERVQLERVALVRLRRRQRAGEMARDRLTRANLRLVVSIAKRHVGRGLPLLDLVQEGNLGLMRAVEKFDPTKGFKFSTYATWWIRQAITRSIADQARTIRIPVHMIETINKLMRVQKQLVQEYGREPTPDEIAEEIHLPVERVRAVLKMAQQPISLQAPVGDSDDTSFGDFIEDKTAENPMEEAGFSMLKEKINEVLDTLTEREREVLEQRFGLKDGYSRTLEEVGRQFQVTRERIRQIEAKALRKMRHPTRIRKLEGFIELPNM